MGAPRRSDDGPYGTPVADDAGGTRRLDPAVSLPGADDPARGEPGRGRRAGRGSRKGQRAGTAGDAAPPDDPADGPDADPEAVARAIVLRRLTAAPRTRAQLADDLRRRAVPDDVAVRVLDRFVEVGLVDDALYAETWVRSRHAGRGLARRALGHELRTRGVDDVTIAEAIESVTPADEEATARSLVTRRLAATRQLPREARIRRLSGLLARKGYAGGLALRVVREEIARDEAVYGRAQAQRPAEADSSGEAEGVLDDDGSADLGFS